jgi:hypothetical protein
MNEATSIFVASVIIALIAWAIKLLLKVSEKLTEIVQWRVGHESQHEAEKEVNTERHNSNYRALIEIRREIHNAVFRWKGPRREDDEGD